MRLNTKTRCKDCALAVPNVSEIWPSCESSGHALWKECVQTDTRCAKPRPYSADVLPADPVDGQAHNTGDKSRPHDVSSPTSAAPAGCPAVVGPMRGSPAGRDRPTARFSPAHAHATKRSVQVVHHICASRNRNSGSAADRSMRSQSRLRPQAGRGPFPRWQGGPFPGRKSRAKSKCPTQKGSRDKC